MSQHARVCWIALGGRGNVGSTGPALPYRLAIRVVSRVRSSIPAPSGLPAGVPEEKDRLRSDGLLLRSHKDTFLILVSFWHEKTMKRSCDQTCDRMDKAAIASTGYAIASPKFCLFFDRHSSFQAVLDHSSAPFLDLDSRYASKYPLTRPEVT
ncbi:unnamed protein product [Lactuca saligna]|uniref:Uncharacterized protein n=1 Tax=Lactuca saligna TaxID=75948 RepID=A0AA36E8U0_LACSI|nr:unnamed protein product [Lactuca saligna]